jgi:hypothetical protein
LAAKGLAPIAVCNKLLKQAFAVAKSGLPYDENPDGADLQSVNTNIYIK